MKAIISVCIDTEILREAKKLGIVRSRLFEDTLRDEVAKAKGREQLEAAIEDREEYTSNLKGKLGDMVSEEEKRRALDEERKSKKKAENAEHEKSRKEYVKLVDRLRGEVDSDQITQAQARKIRDDFRQEHGIDYGPDDMDTVQLDRRDRNAMEKERIV